MQHDDQNLIDFVAGISGGDFLKVEEDLGAGFVRLKISEAERRQAKHDIRSVEDIVVELLRNARDAGAHTIWVASTSEGPVRMLNVIDDGCGVPDNISQLIFEPRVTSKLETMVMDEWGVHGRGMALYSIRQNVAQIELCDTVVGGGSAFAIQVDTQGLKERADQSTWPKVRAVAGRKGAFEVESGPKNIVRHVVEFAVKHPEIDVYFGAPSEVLATMRAGCNPPAPSDLSRTPVASKPALASAPIDLYDAATELGLPISERTAHRVSSGEIRPVETVLATIARNVRPGAPGVDIYRDSRGLKVADQDMVAFQHEVEAAFERLAEKYFLNLGDAAKVRIGRNSISVSIDYDKG